MSANAVMEDRVSRQTLEEPMPGSSDPCRSLAVLVMEPWGDAILTGRIKALGAGIAGVGALRVDAERGRIHVLYDGMAETIARLENTVRIPGHTMRLLGDSPPSGRGTHGAGAPA